jgi:hypothetical protein
MNQLQCVDTGSQVSSIVWNTEYRELITGHGFSQNQLTVWKYPSLAKVTSHTRFFFCFFSICLAGKNSPKFFVIKTSTSGSKAVTACTLTA